MSNSVRPQLLLMVGLPRSGKSTTARAISQDFGVPVVSRDAIRLSVHGHRYIPEAEDHVADHRRHP